MPENKMASVTLKFCPKHNSRSVQYFCDDHGLFCCSVCVTLSHANCSVLQLDKLAESQEYKDLLSEITDLNSYIDKMRTQQHTFNVAFVECFSKFSESIQSFREEINTKLDILQIDLMTESMAFNVVEENLKKLRQMQVDLGEKKLHLESLEKYKQNRQLCVLVNETQSTLQKYKDKMGEISRNQTTKFSFKRNESILNLLDSQRLGILEITTTTKEDRRDEGRDQKKCIGKQTDVETTSTDINTEENTGSDTQIQALGKRTQTHEALTDTTSEATSSHNEEASRKETERLLEENKQKLKTFSETCIRRTQEPETSQGTDDIKDVGKESMKAHFMKQINMKHSIDKKINFLMTQECWVTGLAFMTCNRIALCDHDNSSVKVVDLETDTISAYCQLDSQPYDITFTATNTLIVTSDAELIYLQMEDNSLAVTNRLPIESGCRGIARSRNTMFLTFAGEKRCVQQLDMQGNVLKIFEVDEKEDALFSDPRYIVISKDGETLYVSDRDLHAVKCLNTRGEVVGVYKHKNLKCPTGMALGQAGNIFVAGMASNNIHMIGKDFSLVKIVLEKSVQWPQALLYSDKDSKLYLTRCASNLLNVYKYE